MIRIESEPRPNSVSRAVAAEILIPVSKSQYCTDPQYYRRRVYAHLKSFIQKMAIHSAEIFFIALNIQQKQKITEISVYPLLSRLKWLRTHWFSTQPKLIFVECMSSHWSCWFLSSQLWPVISWFWCNSQSMNKWMNAMYKYELLSK